MSAANLRAAAKLPAAGVGGTSWREAGSCYTVVVIIIKESVNMQAAQRS